MKAWLRAPLSPQAVAKLSQRLQVIYEPWTETRSLLSPEEMAERLSQENIELLVIEADFLFEETLSEAPGLKFVGVCRSRVNNGDLAAAIRRGVRVVYTPARNAAAVAELTIGLMLALARRIPTAHRTVLEGRWEDPVSPYITLQGVELGGKVCGLIGVGGVGREVARRLKAFGMRLLAYDPYLSSRKASEAGVKLVALEELLRQSDFITLHCPLTDETAGLISSRSFSLMKPTAYLVNTAAGGVIDEAALAAALREKRIAGAALDVFESHPLPPKSPLLQAEGLILTPHIGGATQDTIERYSRLLVLEIERFLQGKPPLHPLEEGAVDG